MLSFIHLQQGLEKHRRKYATIGNFSHCFSVKGKTNPATPRRKLPAAHTMPCRRVPQGARHSRDLQRTCCSPRWLLAPTPQPADHCNRTEGHCAKHRPTSGCCHRGIGERRTAAWQRLPKAAVPKDTFAICVPQPGAAAVTATELSSS